MKAYTPIGGHFKAALGENRSAITPIRRSTLLVLWVGTLAFGASATCAALLLTGYRLGHPLATVVLALLAMIAEREAIRVTPTVEVSVASFLCIFAAVVFGPVSAVLVGGVGILADLPRRDCEQPILRWLSWTSMRVIVAGAAGVAARAVLSTGPLGFWSLFAAVAAAFTAETTIDVVFGAVTPAIRGTAAWGETVRLLAQLELASVPLQAPMAAVLAYSYLTISPWSVVLFAVPAVAAQRLLILYRQQRESSAALGVANARLERAGLSFATALVATLDARDRYTAGHSAAVAIYARDIAARLGLSGRDTELAFLCGLVHDVGKIGLPPGLLEKPGDLSPEERRQMEQHSTIGERILRNVDDYGEIAEIVRHHHERLDGSGYPDGLVGDEIPMLSRVVAVADAYNAMTSDRPYRDAMPVGFACRRLSRDAGTQFDEVVVAAFEAVLVGASHDYRVAKGSAFVVVGVNASRAPVRRALEAARAGAAAVMVPS
jgi:putative nucleotidyltransferase with HDIG domain